MLTHEKKLDFILKASNTQKLDFSKIVEFLSRKGIKKLFHFTHIKNLDSILSHGLLSRKFLDNNNFGHQITDEPRWDNFTESISFTIGEPNRLLLPNKNLDFNHQLVVLEISANQLLTQNFAAFPSNAAGGLFQTTMIENPDRYLGIRGLQGMYLNAGLRNEARLPIDVPTDTQSELLFFETIPSSAIQKIHISPNFPIEQQLLVESISAGEGLPFIENSCQCELFSRWEGIFRRYDVGWETNGS